MPNTPLPARAALVVAYLLHASAGVAAAFWPPPSVAASGRLWAYAWGAFLVVGGLMCAVGAIRRTWLGEYLGAPLLIAVWTVFGITAGWAGIQAGRPGSAAGCFALLAVASLITYRWEQLAVYRKASREATTRGRDET